VGQYGPRGDARLSRSADAAPSYGHVDVKRTLLTILMVFPLAASDPLRALSSLSWVALSSGSAEVTVTSTSPLWALERAMKSLTTSEVAVNRPLTESTSRRLTVVYERERVGTREEMMKGRDARRQSSNVSSDGTGQADDLPRMPWASWRRAP
jgi:hypothetical protein